MNTQPLRKLQGPFAVHKELDNKLFLIAGTMKTIFKLCIPILLSLIVTLIASCTKYQISDDPLPDSDPTLVTSCDTDTIYFQNTVLPLVVSSCATSGCHDQASHKDGIILTDYSSIMKTGEIKAGDPGDSEFFESLTDKGDDLMPPPPYDALNSEQIQLIKQWIGQGAKNNECFDGCDTDQVSFTETIWPMMESYCTGCHSSGSPGGGIVIEDHADMKTIANDGSLMGSVRYESGYAKMPTNKQLSECNINQLQKWIDEGMPE